MNAKRGLEKLVEANTYLGVEFVEDVFEVVTLNGLFGVKEIQKFLHELRRDIDLELSDFNGFVDDELQEKLVDALQMRPCRVHFFLLVDTCLSEVQIALLHVWQGSEYILFDHLHDLVEVGDDDADYVFLVLEHLLELRDRVQTLSLWQIQITS